MAKLGYIRVSTVEQNLDRQEQLMNSIPVDRIFQDKASGKNLDRPGLDSMLEFVRPGDEIHVESFSRLSRSTKELLNTVEDLTSKGVYLVSHKEQFDTGTPSGKLMLTVFAAISQFEREIILERQKEGIAIAKTKGVYRGKPRKPETPELLLAMKGWASGELKAEDAIRISGLKKTAFYQRCKEYGYSKKTDESKPKLPEED